MPVLSTKPAPEEELVKSLTMQFTHVARVSREHLLRHGKEEIIVEVLTKFNQAITLAAINTIKALEAEAEERQTVVINDPCLQEQEQLINSYSF